MEVQSMDSKLSIMALLFLAFCFLSLSSRHGVEGGPGRILSEEEDLELEKQLKILNKPPVKTIQHTSTGDIFDCVDINKQPAFDHPLLKNHKIQMKPSFSLGRTKKEATVPIAKLSEIELGDGGCPNGTVPIRRTRKQDLINAILQSVPPRTVEYPGVHIALIETTLETTYYGGSAMIDVYNPSVNADQYSMAQIWVENGPGKVGPGDERNIVHVGWAVHPQLYGDNRTRLTIGWTADGYKKTGCFNLLCPGFVVTDGSSVTIGGPFDETSIIGGLQYGMDARISLDTITGNWWFIWDDKIHVGYWPKELFTHLASGASRIQYGGQTYGPPSGKSPPMGSGRGPSVHTRESCYFSSIMYLRQPDYPIDISPNDIATERDNRDCYDVIYYEDQGSYLRQMFSFGGPGGKCGE